MKKDAKIDKFNQELQKLTKLIDQESQFNNKCLHQLMRNPVNPSSHSEESDEQLSLCTSRSGNHMTTISKHRNSKTSFQQYEDRNYRTPNFYEESGIHIGRRVESTAPIMRLNSELEIDQQATTKSIQVSTYQIEQCEEGTGSLDNIQYDEDDKPTVVMTFERNNRQCTFEQKNGEITSYENSAAATENIEISFDREALENELGFSSNIFKQNLMRDIVDNNECSGMKIKKDKSLAGTVGNVKTCTHTKKPSQSHTKFQNFHQSNLKKPKQRRPATGIKRANVTAITNQSSKKPSYYPSCVFPNYSQNNENSGSGEFQRNKINLCKVNKSQQRVIELEKERKITTRKKTKRGDPASRRQELNNEETRSAGYCKNRNTKKKLSNEQIKQTNLYQSSNQKNLMKTDISIKKLNKNLKKQDSIKFQKPATQTKQPKQHKQLKQIKELKKQQKQKQKQNKENKDNKDNKDKQQKDRDYREFKDHINTKNYVSMGNDNRNAVMETGSVVMHEGVDDGIGQLSHRHREGDRKDNQGHKLVERLDFQNKMPVMERILENNKVFKLYNVIANNYNQASKKINTKYLNNINTELKSFSQANSFKFKVLQIIVMFFSQFFKPSSKTSMGIVSKNKSAENAQAFASTTSNKDLSKPLQNKKTPSPSTSPQPQLILSCLQSPQLVQVIQSLPSLLYSNNVLCDESVTELLLQNETIHDSIDQMGSIELFMIKKSRLFVFLHQLVEFVRFLCQYQLAERVERHNIRINKNGCVMVGYYSSRSRRDQNQLNTKNKRRNKLKEEGNFNFNDNAKKTIKKGYESQRRITQEMQTDRQKLTTQKKQHITNKKIKNNEKNSTQCKKQTNKISHKHENSWNTNQKSQPIAIPLPQIMGMGNLLCQSRQKNNEGILRRQ